MWQPTMVLAFMLRFIISLCTIIGIVFSGYFYLDNRYATAEDLKKIEKRLDYKITADQYLAIQERVWKLRDRYSDIPKDKGILNELRCLETEKELLNKKLDQLQKTGSD